MGKKENRVLFAFGGLVFFGFIVHSGPTPAHAQNQSLGFDSATKAQLERIGGLIVERKSNDEILKAWEGFVYPTRCIDYASCIRFVFESAKAQAEAKARLAQLQINNAGDLKKAVAEERELIRRLKASMKQGNPLGKIGRKRFEITENSIGRFIIRQAGYISSKEELDQYEGHIQWAGKEANLQETAGVALLEYAKDAIQTAVSNISGVGTLQCQMRKIVERKIAQQG